MTNDYIGYIRKQDAVNAVANTEKIVASFNYQYAIDALLALTPADVVQVVRCDDCVYYGSRRWCELHSSVFDDNAFCSYGERKE